MIIHRDRTNLTLDLHGTRIADPKNVFESVWFANEALQDLYNRVAWGTPVVIRSWRFS